MAKTLRTSAIGFSIMAFMVIVTMVTFNRSKRTVMFDPDGPSPRDPPRSEWAKAGEGTSGNA